VGDVVKTVRLSATLRTVAGAKQVEVPVRSQATVRDLLATLKVVNAPLAAYILAPDGTLNAGIQVIVGGRHIEFLQGLETPIGAHEDLMIIPPLMGG
jgi:molybdopterin synthase sulfur carrier subunit/adenylyltransferase/sulfurtransferase